MKPHKWAKEIKAWADGSEIEYDRGDGIWSKTESPMWQIGQEYRIKPQPKEPQYLYLYMTEHGIDFGVARQIHPVSNYHAKFEYIGKIKLEDE